ncbi:hypothetical protein [Salinibacillus xinjiangensis]|uniref:Uncharacterized protein n=1 Tax=Salinibacillus xinjiangensis TaxID=1229268 RepID=A0A6G1X964_9BACI|nr:hypothetical protein [Salinibacillus xinjiangensis]MRG87446.1 hypothetical protein [Salinibacillus xinjiangensis]
MLKMSIVLMNIQVDMLKSALFAVVAPVPAKDRSPFANVYGKDAIVGDAFAKVRTLSSCAALTKVQAPT